MKDHNISFREYVRVPKLLPTLPLTVITLLVGLANLFIALKPDLKPDIDPGALWAYFENIDSTVYLFYWFNVILALYVIIIGGRKFRGLLEGSVKGEDNYYKNLVLKKGADKSESNESNWIVFKMGVNSTVKQFTSFWILCWLFYAINYSIRISGYDDETLLNIFNNLGSLMFIFMFLTLTVSTASLGAFTWIILGFVTAIISASEYYVGNNEIVYSILSGILGAIGIAMFVGSLDSKFANIPLLLILVLFSYSAIQPLYFLLDSRVNLSTAQNELIQSETIIPLILAVALICKIVLFWTVSWLLNTDRLLFTICEEGSLNYQRNKNFEEFDELINTSKMSLN